MKMVAVVGRRAWMALSLVAAMGFSTLGPSAYASTAKLSNAQSSSSMPLAIQPTELSVVGPADGKVVQTVKAEVVVLLGTNDGSGLDPKIDKLPAALKTALKKPPLSAYNSYKLRDVFGPDLAKGTAATRTFPEGDKLSVTLKDVVKGRDSKLKYVLTLSIEGRTINLPSLEVNASEDDYFFVVAPQKAQPGAVVIGVRILP